MSTEAELKQAYYDIDDFIAEVLRLRNDFDGRIMEIGAHWPEHVWGEMFGAAQAGLELLKQHVGASARAHGVYEDLQDALRFKGVDRHLRTQ